MGRIPTRAATAKASVRSAVAATASLPGMGMVERIVMGGQRVVVEW